MRVLAALGGLAVAAFLAGVANDAPLLRLIAKPVPVVCLAVWVARGRGAEARAIALGLLLSAAGDFLLERSEGLFLAGLGAFLVAHVAYLVAFLGQARQPALSRAVPFLLWGALGYLAMRPGLGSLGLPVSLYLAVIVAMMWRAAALVGHAGPPQPREWLGLGGAVLFGMSDTLLGLDRFRAPIDGARFAIILLYWLGQAGIAASAVPGALGYAPGPKGDR